MQLSSREATAPSYYFPENVAAIVKAYLWGTPQAWQRAYREALGALPKYSRTLLELRPTPHCHAKAPCHLLLLCLDEIEENVYCESCGEKTQWCFSGVLASRVGACGICEHYA